MGLTLLIWLPAIRCPSAFTVAAGTVAEASLFIYLTHYQVYPLFGEQKVLGVAAAVVVGILLTRLVALVRTRIRRHPWRQSGWGSVRIGTRLPVRDQPLLSQRRGDDAIGPDQAPDDDPAAARGGR